MMVIELNEVEQKALAAGGAVSRRHGKWNILVAGEGAVERQQKIAALKEEIRVLENGHGGMVVKRRGRPRGVKNGG